MDELAERRTYTEDRIKEIRSHLAESEEVANGKACVYVTGSFGRLEASAHSDLDLFILGKGAEDGGRDGKHERLLTRLQEICIKADLIHVTHDLGIKKFSGDGRYLVHHCIVDLTKRLGTEEDDVTNTFTARLLLLLESRPLLGSPVYKELTEDVIAAYWGEYQDHKTDFMPAFLANDILRLWRTFCVNYEARTKRAPEIEKAERKLKNYKLKHSRLLTCYSALLFLLAVYVDKSTVSPVDAMNMIELTPTQRLEWLLEQSYLSDAHEVIGRLLKHYSAFLQTTNAEEKDLLELFSDPVKSHEFMDNAYDFGDSVFEVLKKIGGENRFHRLLVV